MTTRADEREVELHLGIVRGEPGTGELRASLRFGADGRPAIFLHASDPAGGYKRRGVVIILPPTGADELERVVAAIRNALARGRQSSGQ